MPSSKHIRAVWQTASCFHLVTRGQLELGLKALPLGVEFHKIKESDWSGILTILARSVYGWPCLWSFKFVSFLTFSRSAFRMNLYVGTCIYVYVNINQSEGRKFKDTGSHIHQVAELQWCMKEEWCSVEISSPPCIQGTDCTVSSSLLRNEVRICCLKLAVPPCL